MRVEIGLTVTFDTPFSIGSGALADSEADKPLIKDAGGRPVIPGSTVKGRVRDECERIIRALIPDFDQHWECRPPHPDNLCRADPAAAGWRQGICPVCRVFGAPWHPAPVIFENLALVVAEGSPPRGWDHLRSTRATTLRHGIGVGRKRAVSEQDLLYSTETYAPPAALVYRGRIWGSLAERREVALLLAGLRATRAIGGARSRGLGWWQVQITLSIDGKLCVQDDVLQEVGQWSN